jgi:hypothetical protein
LQKQQRRSKISHKIGPVNRSEPLIKLRKDDEPTGKENFFLAVRSEREQDQPSDQAKIKSGPSDLIGDRSTVGRHCGDQERSIGEEALHWGSERKLKCEQVVSPQSLKIIDLVRSTDQRRILIPLRTSIFTLRRSARRLKSEQVESPQSLVVIDLQASDTRQAISYSGRKPTEAEE